MSDEVYVNGVGSSLSMDRSLSIEDLVCEVATNALSDAGLGLDEISAIFFSNSLSGILDGQASIRGQAWLYALRPERVPIFNIENAGAGGATAVAMGRNWVLAHERPVLVIGAEKMAGRNLTDLNKIMEPKLALDATNSKNALGCDTSFQTTIQIPQNSLRVAREMLHQGTPVEHFAVVAEKNYKNAALLQSNSRPLYSKEEILSSPEISYPFTKLMCASFADGAAALVLSNIRQNSSPQIYGVQFKGGIQMTSPLSNLKQFSSSWWEKMSIGPEEIDVVELCDFTSVDQLYQLECMGFFKEGEAGFATISGETDLTGKIYVNPSGGLVGGGFPIGATGVLQVVETTHQLRGSAKLRQRPNARFGVCLTLGGQIYEEPDFASMVLLKSVQQI